MNESTKLSEEKLFEIFKSLNVPMRMSDLKTPTKEFVISVFDTFLRDLQINIANPLIRPFECVSHLENPDLFEEGQSYIILAAAMNQVLRNYCQNPVTVTISDIVAPKPKKTKKILNFVVVVWNYVLQKLELFSQVCNALQPEIQKAEEVIRECESLDSNYQECLEKLNTVTTPKEELRKLFAIKNEIHKKHDITQKTIVQDYQKLKEKESQLQTEKVNMDLMIATNKETINELDQLIISSPEKVKSDVQKLKDMIKDVEEKILEKEQDKKEKKKVNQNKVSSQEDLLKSNAKIQKLLGDLQSLMENIQTLTKVHGKCQEENMELKELQSAQEAKENMANFYEEKFTKIKHLKMKQIEEINKTYEMLQRQLSEEMQQIISLSSSIAESEKDIESQVDTIISIVDNCKVAEVETKKFKSQYKQAMLDINNKFKEDCEEISKKFKRYLKFLD